MTRDESWSPAVILTSWQLIHQAMQAAKKEGVMSVEAYPLHDPRPNGPCRIIQITVTPKEGYGQAFTWRIVHISGESVPTVVELHMMEYGALCTWAWRSDYNGRYTADFAGERSLKAIRDSRSYTFPSIL